MYGVQMRGVPQYVVLYGKGSSGLFWSYGHNLVSFLV